MQVPLEIAFHNLDPVDWAEQEIRDRVADLQRIYDRLSSCRVRIQQRARNDTGTIPPVVHIALGVPGHADIVVSHEPDHLQLRYQRPDLNNAIHEAFRIAERRLADLKRQRGGRGRERLPGHEMLRRGEIAEVDADHGFLLTAAGELLYFHRNALAADDFERLERGTAVSYLEGMGDSGPAAVKVRIRPAA